MNKKQKSPVTLKKAGDKLSIKEFREYMNEKVAARSNEKSRYKPENAPIIRDISDLGPDTDPNSLNYSELKKLQFPAQSEMIEKRIKEIKKAQLKNIEDLRSS